MEEDKLPNTYYELTLFILKAIRDNALEMKNIKEIALPKIQYDVFKKHMDYLNAPCYFFSIPIVLFNENNNVEIRMG